MKEGVLGWSDNMIRVYTKKAIIGCIAIIMFMSSCSTSEFLSVEYVEKELRTESTVTVFANPATYYEVSINENFMSLLELECWESVQKEDASQDIEGMLYFDLSN